MIPENNDCGDEEVQRHFEGNVMPDVSATGAECAEVPLEGLTQKEKQGILSEIVDEYNHKLRNTHENVVICQRRESRFWDVFFHNIQAKFEGYLRR